MPKNQYFKIHCILICVLIFISSCATNPINKASTKTISSKKPFIITQTQCSGSLDGKFIRQYGNIPLNTKLKLDINFTIADDVDPKPHRSFYRTINNSASSQTRLTYLLSIMMLK